MIELQTSVKQDDTTRTRTPKPGYLNLSNNGMVSAYSLVSGHISIQPTASGKDGQFPRRASHSPILGHETWL